MNGLAKRCWSSSEACGRRCRKATSRARRPRLTRRSPRSRKISVAGPGCAPRFADTDLACSQQASRAPRAAPPPRPRNSLPPSAPARPLRLGRPRPRRDRPPKTMRRANPGLQPCPFRARRSDLRRRHRDGDSQPGVRSRRRPRLREASPKCADGGLAARSQLAAAMANQPSSVSRTGRTAPPVGVKDGKDEVCPD